LTHLTFLIANNIDRIFNTTINNTVQHIDNQHATRHEISSRTAELSD